MKEKTDKSVVQTNIKSKTRLIMIADDDADDRELFTEAVSECDRNFKVIEAGSGRELMQILSESIIQPDYIFLDLNMPGKDGKECLSEIRSDDRFMDIPVIIYSTSLNEKDIEDTFEAGANLYIAKPNAFSLLIETINRALFMNPALIRKSDRNLFILNLQPQL